MNNTEKKPLLIVEYLDKYFKKSDSVFCAVNNANFTVNEGDFFGIIGESGSGKSTIGKMLIRLLPTDKGVINFDGNFISANKISKKVHKWLTQNMQMIFQDPLASLNPKKNVLNLIAEPLKIKKTLSKESKQIIRDHNKINNYFQYTYKQKDFEISKKFDDEYFTKMIEIYKQKNEELSKYVYENQYSLEENKFNLLNILLGLDEETKTVNYSLYQYTKDIKDVFYQCKQIHDNKQNHELEIELFDIIEEVNKYKKLSRYPQVYWDTISQRKQLKDKLEDLSTNSYCKYEEQIPNFIKAVLHSINNEIKNLKFKINLSKNILDVLKLKIEIFTKKTFIGAIKKLENSIILDVEETKRVIDKIADWSFEETHNIRFIYKELIKYKKQNDQIIEELFQENLINSFEYKQLLELDFIKIYDIKNKFKKAKNILNLNKKIKQIINKEENKKLFKNIELINKTFSILWDLINNKDSENYVELTNYKDIFSLSDFESYDLRLKAKKQYLDTENKIIELNQKLLSIKKNKKEEKYSLEILENVTILNNLLTKKQIIKQNCNEHYLEDIQEFNKEVNPKIKEHKIQLKKYKSDLNLVQRQTKSITRNILKSSYKKLNKEEKKEFKLSFKTDVKSKLKTIDSLKFEFNTILEEVQLYRLLRNKNKLIVWMNLRHLNLCLMKDKVYKSLESVGLKKEHAYRYPHEFSGGQRQRIVIARALINNPKLIIADEPISALDVSIQAQVINIMKKLSEERGITFIFIAHDLSMVNYACNRMIIMHNGTILEKGETKEIFDNPIHPYTLSLLKAAPQLSKIHIDLAEGAENLYYKPDPNDKTELKFYSVSEEHEHEVFGTKTQVEQWKNQTH